MNDLKEIITVASACLGLIATATGFLIPLVKNVKAKNRLAALNKFTAALQTLIVDAETFAGFTGEEKKAYVMTKANRYALDNKIPYDEHAVSNRVEELVALSKQVNTGETKSVNEEGVTAIKI
ncbi:MAG: hypothetical protein NC132_02395 [Corallococcus sp.]|nr:hypothetical protein [Corallococcus sp.]MCM1358958.1 hypothetical protein [Corallococcus sp.]MCM1394947.1 hypothetical protein [Corallococcus sp.]